MRTASYQLLPATWTVDRMQFQDVHHGHYTIRRNRDGSFECAYRRVPSQEWDVFAVDVLDVYAAILECERDMRRLDAETFDNLPLDVEF
jgi:hypothetical protein